MSSPTPIFFESRSHSIALTSNSLNQVDIKLVASLQLAPECWTHRHVSVCSDLWFALSTYCTTMSFTLRNLYIKNKKISPSSFFLSFTWIKFCVSSEAKDKCHSPNEWSLPPSLTCLLSPSVCNTGLGLPVNSFKEFSAHTLTECLQWALRYCYCLSRFLCHLLSPFSSFPSPLPPLLLFFPFYFHSSHLLLFQTI